MTALTADRDTQNRPGLRFSYPAKGGVMFYVGAIAAVDSATGFATRGAASTTLKSAGIVQEQIDNTAGADGALNVPMKRGIWRVPFITTAASSTVTSFFSRTLRPWQQRTLVWS